MKRKIRKIINNSTALFLMLLMVFGSAPYVALASSDFVDFAEADFVHIEETSAEELSIIYSEENLVTFLPETVIPAGMSIERYNYYALLEGNYAEGELRERFLRLFGWHSAENILNYYNIIFDIPSGSVDARVLRVLTAYPLPQIYFNIAAGDVAPSSTILCELLPDANVIFEEMPMTREMGMLDELSEYIPIIDWTAQGRGSFENIPSAPEFMEAVPTPSPTPPPPPYYAQTGDVLQSLEHSLVEPLSSVGVDISVYRKGYTYVILNVYFRQAYSGNNNSLDMLDFTRSQHGTWVPQRGPTRFGLPQINTGRVTINNLARGGTYMFAASTWSSTQSRWINAYVTITLPGMNQPSVRIRRSVNSFELNVVFPVDGNWGNILEFHDGTRWRTIANQGWHTRNGTYTVNNLRPGGT